MLTSGVLVAFIVWGTAVPALFALDRSSRSVVVAFVAGALFLPVTGIPTVMGLHTKAAIICTPIVVCSLIFGLRRWLAFRPIAVDKVIIAWSLLPFGSSVMNGLGIYDGLSAAYERALLWAVPYLLGRLYFSGLRGVRTLAIAIFAGGLIYVPFCWWEIRMSPQLHYTLYGFQQHEDFAQAVRAGGFRPYVFLEHGLTVAFWMAAASIIAFWMWRARTLTRFLGLPMKWLVLLLMITTIFCKSLGPLIVLVIGCGLQVVTQKFRSALPLALLIAVSPLYMSLRMTKQWSGESLVSMAAMLSNEERAGSLKGRIDNETMLIAKAVEKPMFGWARWGRSRVYDAENKDISVTDGFWVIVLGSSGLLGLSGFVFCILAPALLILKRWPSRRWTDPEHAPAVACAVVLGLYMIDCLFNASFNPVFQLTMGSLVGTLVSTQVQARATTRLNLRPEPAVR